MKYIIVLAILILNYSCKNKPDRAVENIKFPENIVLSEQFKETIEEQKKEFYRIFRKDTLKFKSYSTEFMLDKIDNDSDYEYIFISEYWLAFNYREMIPELISRITDNTEIGLENYADMSIPERVESGDMEFYGHGVTVGDDLFKVSGRANHLLTRIVGQNFGLVTMNSTQSELVEMRKKWIEWLNEL